MLRISEEKGTSEKTSVTYSIKRYLKGLKSKYKIFRVLIWIFVIIGFILAINYLADLNWIPVSFESSDLVGILRNHGGAISLMLTFVVLLVYVDILGHKPKDLKKSIKDLDIISAILIGVIVIALWLTIRIAGLHVLNYLTEEGYKYNQFEIFNILAYALTVNLCFSLFKHLKIEEGQSDIQRIKNIIGAAMQAVLIGIIVILPRWSDEKLIDNLSVFGFVSILITMVLTLLILMYIRKKM